MAEINNLLAAGGRTLRLTGNLLLPTGAQQVLQAEDILRAEIDEGVDGALMPGDVLCANLSLWLCKYHRRAGLGHHRDGSSVPGHA